MGTRFNITDAKGKKRTHQRSWQEVNEKAGRLNDTKLALIEMTCGGSSRYLEMTGDQSWFDCEQVRSGDNLAGRKRGQDVISSVLYHRGSSLDEKKKNPKKRERNSIWPILDILIQLSGNVTCDFSAIRYLTAVDIRCLTSSPGKRCILLTPYSAVLRRETSPSPLFHPRFLSSFAKWSPVDQTFVLPNWFRDQEGKIE